MLKLKMDGLWRDNKGFIAAIMLKWNTPEDENGRKHYKFLANHFNTIPHDIVSNGEDDSILLSEEMYKVLLEKKVIRPITAEEAEQANENSDIMDENKTSAAGFEEADRLNQIEKDKPASTTNPSQQAKPVPLKIAPQEPLTELQSNVIADAIVGEKTSPQSSGKKGAK